MFLLSLCVILMQKHECVACSKKPLSKNEIGINIKLLGEGIKTYYCIDCLAEYLGVSVDDIYDKIEEFKEDGCKLFD